MRVLIDTAESSGVSGRDGSADLDDAALARLYAAPRTPWLRVNMVASLDGAAAGESGRSGSINNPADKRVFDTLRGLADAIVVGAGTARAEGYGPAPRPIVLVSNRAEVPERLRDAEPGQVVMATHAAAPGLAGARDLLGAEHVLVSGEEAVDLTGLKAALVGRGLTDLLCEGGPSLLRALLHHGAADEVTVTTVPRLVGGDGPRIVTGAPLDVRARLALLLEDDGTLLARWMVEQSE